MHQVWPLPARSLDADDVEGLYRYPERERWVAVNFVSSLDGGIEMDGRSGGLSTPADRPYGHGGLNSKYQGQSGPTPSQYWRNFDESTERPPSG